MVGITENLVEIPRFCLPKLRNLFLVNWPRHVIGHELVNNYMRWFEIDPSFDEAKFYCLNGDWSDGTILVVDNNVLLPYAFEENAEKLQRLIALLPPNHLYFCMGVEEPLVPAIKLGFQALKIYRKTDEYYGDVYYLDPQHKNQVLNEKEPSNAVLKPLSEDNIPQIDSVYLLSGPTTAQQFRQLLKFNISVGAFDEPSGKLMAWCMRHKLGGLYCLQVEEKYKRQGLASLMIRQMTKELRKNGEVVYTFIMDGNSVSRAMFGKLGFRNLGLFKVAMIEFYLNSELKL